MGKIDVEIRPAPQGRAGRIRKGILTLTKDFLSPLATVIIAYFVFHYGREFNDTQVKIQQTQTNLQVMSKFRDLLQEIDEEDELKKTLAVVSIAQFGEDALPPIRLALGA